MAKMSISACSSPYLAPLAASARPYSSSCVFARHPVASFDQLRRGCCPPLAWLLPLACGCCKPPLHRASQQLPLLSCFRWYTEPPFSSSLAPHRAAAHLFAGRLKDPIASTAEHEDELAERSCNASGPSACTNTRPRARWIHPGIVGVPSLHCARSTHENDPCQRAVAWPLS